MPITLTSNDHTYLPQFTASFTAHVIPPTTAYYGTYHEQQCQIIDLIAITSVEPTGSIYEYYYHTLSNTIYYFSGLRWVSMGAPKSYGGDGVIYKLKTNGLLYHSVGTTLNLLYYSCRIYENIHVDVGETHFLYGVEADFLVEYESQNILDTFRYIPGVKYYDDSGNQVYGTPINGIDEAPMVTIRGTSGALNHTSSYTVPDYPIARQNIVDMTVEVIPNSQNTGSVLVPIDDSSYYGFIWVVFRNTVLIDIEDAIKGGIITVISKDASYNKCSLSIQYNVPGNYIFICYARSRIINGDTVDIINTPCGSFDTIVYNPSKPVLSLVSVTPTEYQTGSTDPLNGMPPYTVQWRDDTATADALQIPQKNIAVDFGDSESGIANKIFIENTGNTLIAVPLEQLSHIYGGYGAYVAQITITDKNGNTTTSNAQFEPNQTPRLIKPPVLTPLTGDQPLLVEGNAYVAGSPLPDVKWSYALRGGDPNYYAGEKEGVYAQLSLLAGGTYDVTCEAKNEDTVIDTTLFEVEVDPQDTYEDAAVAMNNFDVAVYDSGGNLVDLMQPADHVKYVDNYASGAAVSFRVPMSYRFIERLTRYCIFDVGYLNKARRMVVVGFSESQDGTYVEIQGKDLPSFISGWRVATVATNSTSGNGKDVQVCSGEALIRYWATVNNSPGTLRQVNEIVVVGENLDRGDKCVYSARFGKISDTLTDICGSSGLGYESSLQESGKVGIKVISGVDRDILFSDAKDGVRNAVISPYSAYEEPNVAIGAGGGEGASRQYTDYGNTTAGGLSRREIFVDAGDSATPEEVEREANLQLLQNENGGLHLTPTPDCPYKFSIDYFVGDYVMVRTKSGLFLRLQITSAETSNYPGEGIITVLYCGADIRTQTKINREMQLSNLYAKK